MRYMIILLLLSCLLTGCTTNHYDCLDASADHIGEVIEIDKERHRILINEYFSTYSSNQSKKWITVRDDTELLSRGKEVSFNNLKLGDLVVAWNNGVIQDSYPSQTTAIKLNIVSYRFLNDCIYVEEGLDPPYFTGRVIGVGDNKRYINSVGGIFEQRILVKGSSQYGDEEIIFGINSDTELVNRNGKVLDLHSLRRKKVKVWIHDGADILRSLPGQVMAVKVVVY